MDPLLTLTCIKLRREGGDLWEANNIIHELNSLIFTRGMDHSLQLSHQCDHTCKATRAPAPEWLPDFLNVPHC